MAVRNAANFRAQYLRWLLFLYEIFEVKNSLILYVVSGFKCPRHRPKRFKGAHSHNSLRRSGTRATFTILCLGALNSFFFLWNNYSKEPFVSPRPEQFVFMLMSSRLLRAPLKIAKKSACSVQAIFWLPPSRGRGGVRGNTLRDRRSVCKNWENINSGTLSLVSLWLLLFKNSHFILYKMSWNWNVWWRNLDKQRLTLNWRKWSLKLTQQTQVCLWIVWSWSKRDRYPQISVRNN